MAQTFQIHICPRHQRAGTATGRCVVCDAERVQELERERDDARDALLKYGDHHSVCAIRDNGALCVCGFSAARKAAGGE